MRTIDAESTLGSARPSGSAIPGGRAASSGSEESGRDDGYTVGPAVGVSSGVDQYCIGQLVADAFAQPLQVLEVVVIDGGRQLDLYAEQTAVRPGEDEVDLVLASMGAQVTYLGLGRLSVDAQVESHQTLEQGTQKSPVSGYDGTHVAAGEEFGGADA